MSINSMADTKTDLYCIFGTPVSHSKSPVMHNALFNENNINAVYLAFDIDNIQKGINAVRELNIKGVSITIPFKEKVIEYLDYIDEQAMAIGAVNTIVNKNGRLKGYNTDWIGGIEPLSEHGIKDKKIALIGAGGAAHAIAYGIKKKKGALTIINRNRKKGEELASLFSSNFLKIDEFRKGVFDIIINTTPLGMTPDIKNTPIAKELLNKNMIVMDIIYNPIETQLIKDAKKIGCKTIDGLSMFVNQGARQFQLWTGIKPSIEFMKKIVIKELK